MIGTWMRILNRRYSGSFGTLVAWLLGLSTAYCQALTASPYPTPAPTVISLPQAVSLSRLQVQPGQAISIELPEGIDLRESSFSLNAADLLTLSTVINDGMSIAPDPASAQLNDLLPLQTNSGLQYRLTTTGELLLWNPPNPPLSVLKLGSKGLDLLTRQRKIRFPILSWSGKGASRALVAYMPRDGEARGDTAGPIELNFSIRFGRDFTAPTKSRATRSFSSDPEATVTVVFGVATPIPGTQTEIPIAPAATSTATPNRTATRTPTPTNTRIGSPSPSETAAATSTSRALATAAPTIGATATTASTPTTAPTRAPAATNTAAPNATNTAAPEATNTQTATATRTATPTATTTSSPRDTNTPIPIATATNTTAPKPTNTQTPTATRTATPTATATSTPTHTNTPTPTVTNSATPTSTSTATRTPAPQATTTPASTSTATPTRTPASTATFTATSTSVPTHTATPISTATPTATPTTANWCKIGSLSGDSEGEEGVRCSSGQVCCPNDPQATKGTCTDPKLCCRKFKENLNQLCLKPQSSEEGPGDQRDLICCSTSSDAPVDNSESRVHWSCIDKGKGAIPDVLPNGSVVNNGNRSPMCLSDPCDEQFPRYQGVQGSPACRADDSCCQVKEQKYREGVGFVDVLRFKCLADFQVDRSLPGNNTDTTRAVCGPRCDKIRQNMVGGEGLCEGDDEACCRYSEADKFMCIPIGTALNLEGNTAPNCLSEPCDADKQNEPNADGTRYCCAKNCRDRMEYGWVAQGAGYVCGSDPSDTLSNNGNGAPGCVGPTPTPVCTECEMRDQNGSSTDSSLAGALGSSAAGSEEDSDGDQSLTCPLPTPSPTPERIELTEAQMRQKASDASFDIMQCHKIGASPERSFPASLVVDRRDNWNCQWGKCDSRTYLSQPFLNIEDQEYVDGAKIYYMALLYKGGPNEFDEFGESLEDREVFVGWQMYRVRKEWEVYDPTKEAHSQISRRVEQAPPFGNRTPRAEGDITPYIFIPWNHHNTYVVSEQCYKVGDPEPYTVNLSAEDRANGFGGGSQVTYTAGDSPTLLGYIRTHNQDLAQLLKLIDALEVGITVVAEVTPFVGTACNAYTCAKTPSLTCLGELGLDVVGDALTVVALGVPAKLTKIHKIAQLTQYGMIPPNLALSAYHANQGDWGKALGRAISPGVDIGVVAYKRGRIAYRSLRQKSKDLPCSTCQGNLGNTPATICKQTSTCLPVNDATAEAQWLLALEAARQEKKVSELIPWITEDNVYKTQIDALGDELRLSRDRVVGPGPGAETNVAELKVYPSDGIGAHRMYSLVVTLFHETCDARFMREIATSIDPENQFRTVFKPEFLSFVQSKVKGTSVGNTPVFDKFKAAYERWNGAPMDDETVHFLIAGDVAEFMRELRSRKLQSEFYGRYRVDRPEIRWSKEEARYQEFLATGSSRFRQECINAYVKSFWQDEGMWDELGPLYEALLNVSLIDDFLVP